MAIVKMKKLRLVGMRSQREELLRQLQHLGCVEIDELAARLSDPAWAALARPDTAALSRARDERGEMDSALDALKKYAGVKSSFLKPRPVITESELFNDGTYQSGLIAAREINDTVRRIGSLYAEQNKLKTQKLSLAPWLELDLPLETASTPGMAVLFGTVSSGADCAEVENALHASADLAELVWAGKDRELRYFVLICHSASEEAAVEALKQFGFSRAALRGWTGTAKENDLRLDQEIARLEGELSQAKTEAASYGDRKALLELCADRAAQEIAREENRCRLLDSETAFFLEGWVPVSDEGQKLSGVLSGYTVFWETADPTAEEYPDVPVKLKNNALTKPLNMVTEMYSLPAYDGVDPNPLMAPFFILFYGIMLADMGYGLLMMIASVIVLRKARPKGGMHNFFALLGLCGISTFLVGMLTGGFFGDMIPQLLKIINPESTFVWFWPPLFTPLDDTLMILVGAMCLGFVQILTGMVVSFVKKLQDGQVMDAVWEELTWWIVFAGAGLAIGGITNLVLILGGIMVLVGSGWNAKGFGKITAVFGSLYNHVTGYFGDILSYSRLMALMLAGSVIAQVFNTLGAIPGNIVVFFIISLAGNALNFALNLLGCYVHDLRLQCLEYFGKFYKDGGKPFRPLEVKTKFVDIE